MKLLGSVRLPAPEVREALLFAAKRRDEVTHEKQNDQMEKIIKQLDEAEFSFDIFKTRNAYSTWIGDQRFTYHDELKVELITKGCKIQNY